jgi:hypothetical protein
MNYVANIRIEPDHIAAAILDDSAKEAATIIETAKRLRSNIRLRHYSGVQLGRSE